MGEQFNKMILRNVAEMRARTQSLKERSDYYPAVLVEYEGVGYGKHDFVASTLLRKEWKGTWYTIHHVQRYCSSEDDKAVAETEATGHLLRMMAWAVYNAQHLYIINGKFEDIDKLQISEEERLRSLMPKHKEKS